MRSAFSVSIIFSLGFLGRASRVEWRALLYGSWSALLRASVDTASSGDTILVDAHPEQNKKKVINSDFSKRIWVEKWNNSWILQLKRKHQEQLSKKGLHLSCAFI
jgi:hypothetical protein